MLKGQRDRRDSKPLPGEKKTAYGSKGPKRMSHGYPPYYHYYPKN